VRPFFTSLPKEPTEVIAIVLKAVWRVWYGKRLGIQRSFEDVGNFDSAVNFAAFVDADRIEVVREPITLPAETAAWRSFGNRSTV
jgi:hypothetical protein